MAALKMWVATCDVCSREEKFDASLDVDELGEAMRVVGWSTPGYGGAYCPLCTRAIEKLSKR